MLGKRYIKRGEAVFLIVFCNRCVGWPMLYPCLRRPDWGLCYQEDAYLREHYPLYAGTSSAFTVLSTSEEMEGKQRTEEQIKARVKKLGLSAVSPAPPKETDDGLGDEEAEADGAASGQEDNTMEDKVEDAGSAKPGLRVRKLKRKNQADSDGDSEGMFSSVEVCGWMPRRCGVTCFTSNTPFACVRTYIGEG